MQTAGIGFHKVMERKRAESPAISRDFKITTEGLRQSGSTIRAGAECNSQKEQRGCCGFAEVIAIGLTLR